LPGPGIPGPGGANGIPCGGEPAFGKNGMPGIPWGAANGICGGGQGRCAGKPAGRGPEKFIGGGMPA
jgi:hypothetical protein